MAADSISILLFLAAQTGGLIWKLSDMNRQLKNINQELFQNGLASKILQIDKRITRVETRCDAVDIEEILHRINAIEKTCILHHGGPPR